MDLGRSRQVLPTAVTSWGDTRRVSSPLPGGARVFIRLSSCVFQVYNSNKDNQSEGSKYFFSRQTPEKVAVLCGVQTLVGQQERLSCRQWGQRAGLCSPGPGVWGDRGQRGDHTVALGRSWVWHLAGNWCRNLVVGPKAMESGAELLPWHSGLRPLLPAPHPAVPGPQQWHRGCWCALGPAGPAPLAYRSQRVQVASWTSQLSFLSWSVEDD